jgi:hypothetical protein
MGGQCCATTKKPQHLEAEAAFKKRTDRKEGMSQYETDQARKLANMDRLRAERLARQTSESAESPSKAPSPRSK